MAARTRGGAGDVNSDADVGCEPDSEGVVRCDVLVLGSGAGGLSAAITARRLGLDVLCRTGGFTVDFRTMHVEIE